MNPRIKTAALISVWVLSIACSWWIGKRSSPVQESQSSIGPVKPPAGGKAVASGETLEGVSEKKDTRLTSFISNKGLSEPAKSTTMPQPFVARVVVSENNARNILTQSDPIQRSRAFLDLLENMTPSNVQEILAAFNELEGGADRGREMSLLLYRWAQLDGEAAIAHVRSTSSGRGRDRGGSFYQMGSVLTGWATAEPDAAIAWAKANYEGEENPYMMGVINGIAKTDLARATLLAQELPYGRVRGQVAESLIDGVFQDGPDAAMLWARSLPEGRLREGIITRVAGRVARTDPYVSATWVMNVAGDDSRPEAVATILNEWSRKDPEGAAKWLGTVQDPAAKASGMERVAGVWGSRDPEAAGAWLSEFSRGPELDGALEQYVRSIRRRDPEKALNWATAITDEEKRRPLLEQIMRDWQRSDPAGADSFLNRIQ